VLIHVLLAVTFIGVQEEDHRTQSGIRMNRTSPTYKERIIDTGKDQPVYGRIYL
jgi:hypothetical protein